MNSGFPEINEFDDGVEVSLQKAFSSFSSFEISFPNTVVLSP